MLQEEFHSDSKSEFYRSQYEQANDSEVVAAPAEDGADSSATNGENTATADDSVGPAEDAGDSSIVGNKDEETVAENGGAVDESDSAGAFFW